MQNTIIHSQAVSSVSQFQNAIMEFAKTNKVSRAKVEAYTATIIASLPMAKVSQGKTGRPVLEKTQALHKAIMLAINNGREGKRDAVTVRKVVSVDYPVLDKVTFNNAISALIKQGKIQHAGKAKTGSRGRQPFILSINKQE